jgi:hypothetical protein
MLFYAKSAATAATAATAHTPAALIADDVGAGVVWPGGTEVGAAVVFTPTDNTVMLSVPTAEYTEPVLVNHDVEEVAAFTPDTSCDGDLPLPWATPKYTTSEPTLKSKMVRKVLTMDKRVARSVCNAVCSWASAVALERTYDQLAPLRRRVATMS